MAPCFAHRYGHRAVVLATVAAVPGMVSGSLQHLRALRRMKGEHGWIRTLLVRATRSTTKRDVAAGREIMITRKQTED
jgi:hypothetical protein